MQNRSAKVQFHKLATEKRSGNVRYSPMSLETLAVNKPFFVVGAMP